MLKERSRKKTSTGFDAKLVYAKHFEKTSDLLMQHLLLLFQMPNSSCEVAQQSYFMINIDCQSYCPITVLCTLLKISESIILSEIPCKCYAPPQQFGFQKELSWEHALYAFFNVLDDVDGSGDFLVLSALDRARAFDSYIFTQKLPGAIKRGVDPSGTNCLCYMYSHLKAKIKGVQIFSIYLRVSDRVV